MENLAKNLSEFGWALVTALRERYHPTDHEIATTDITEEGSFNEDGGTLGNRDWEVVLMGNL